MDLIGGRANAAGVDDGDEATQNSVRLIIPASVQAN